MNTSITSPGGAVGQEKGKKKQNVVPVSVKEVMSAPEEGFMIEGMEVGMVILVGRVVGVDQAATKTVYQLEDDTGVVEVIQWLDEGTKSVEHVEGSGVRVVGSIRNQGEKRHVMAFKIDPVAEQAQLDSHLLEIVCSQLKMRKLQHTLTGQAEGATGLSNSMVGGGLVVAPVVAAGQSFGKSSYDLVYNLIRGCMEEQGVERGAVLESVGGKCSKLDVDTALDFLSSEGHIYSTVDEDHFKTTDD